MAKSLLTKALNKRTKQTSTNVVPINKSLFKLKTSSGRVVTCDLHDLQRQGCEAQGALVSGRKAGIEKLIQYLARALKDDANQGSLYGQFLIFKNYIIFCDQYGHEAFSVEGVRAFYEEFWRQVALYEGRKPYLFQYKDADELGLKESVAYSQWFHLFGMLSLCGFDTFYIGLNLRPFSSGDKIPYIAYQFGELKTLRTRLQDYFFSLAIPLIAEPGNTPSERLMVEVGGTSWFVENSYAANDKRSSRMSFGSPFNQAMAAGYYLLAFYTAFNDGVLRQICHPLAVEDDCAKARGSRWYNLSAFKPRANKEVRALVGDDVEVLKSECRKSGLKFIKTLEALSKKYNPHQHGLLLYNLAEDGGGVPFDPSKFVGSNSLALLLNLTTSNKHHLADHLIEQFRTLITERVVNEVTVPKKSLFRCVKKETVSHSRPNMAVPHLAYCALNAIAKGDVEFKGALLPLEIIPKGASEIQVRFLREGEDEYQEFVCERKYQPFLEELQAYADRINPMIKRKTKVNRTRYLLPYGNLGKGFRQWDGLTPSTASILNRVGVRSGDYFLDLNASRLRETSAQLARLHAEDETEVSIILGNSLAVALTHYAAGNPEENQFILTEGIQVLQAIASGKSIQDAKEEVRVANGITLLTIEELVKRDGYLNAAGFFCEGHEGDNEEHRKTAHRARNYGFDKEKLPCFQHDHCYKCDHGKLVDDLDAVYRQLSFIECLEEGVNHFPENAQKLQEKSSAMFAALKSNMPEKTLDQALERLLNEGRHPLYADAASHAALQV